MVSCESCLVSHTFRSGSKRENKAVQDFDRLKPQELEIRIRGQVMWGVQYGIAVTSLALAGTAWDTDAACTVQRGNGVDTPCEHVHPAQPRMLLKLTHKRKHYPTGTTIEGVPRRSTILYSTEKSRLIKVWFSESGLP